MPHPDYNYRAGVLIGSIGPDAGEQKPGPLSPRHSRDGALLKHTKADVEAWLDHLREDRTGNIGEQGDETPRTHFVTLLDPVIAVVEQAISECRDFLSQFSDRSDWNGGSLNFIFAGHGTTRGDLVLADAKLSPDELMSWLAEGASSDGPSRKLQLALDSCYSGMTLARLLCHESHRAGVLLVDAFAAAMHDEKAWELTSLGHGALTFTMTDTNSLNIGGNADLALAIELRDEEEMRKHLYRVAPNPVLYLTEADQHSLELINGHDLSIKGLGTLDILRPTTPEEICEHLASIIHVRAPT